MKPLNLLGSNLCKLSTASFVPLLLTLFLLLVSLSSFAAEDDVFIPFDEFYKSVKEATFEDHIKLASTKVSSQEEFERMKKHILETYRLVDVKHSFILDGTGHTDCINMHTQPSLRRGDVFLKISTPPKAAIFKEDFSTPRAEFVAPMLNDQKMDQFGNRLACQNEFIPMARIELKDVVRFESLAAFFNKFGKAGENAFPQADKS